jgi:glycosidase
MKKALILLIPALLLAAVAPGLAAAQEQASAVRLITTETRLGRFGADTYPDTVTVSPDGKRLAYAAEREGCTVVVVDGMEGEKFNLMGRYDPIFSPDSERVAYAAARGRRQLVVLDGVPGKEYDYAGWPRFSPDGKHVAYGAAGGDGEYMVIDGLEGEKYDSVRWVVFSPDGGRYAYTARQGDQSFLVIDGVEGEGYNSVDRPVFSADGKHIAYSARRGRQSVMVVDGVESEQEYGSSRQPAFSADGARFAYSARRGRESFVVVDGVEQKAYEDIVLPTFSPDGKRLAYLAQQDEVWHFVIDGVEGRGYDSITYWSMAQSFSPDSKHFAYFASRDEKWFLVVDGEEAAEFESSGDFAFSPAAGGLLACSGRREGKWAVFIEGQETGGYDRLLNDSELTFDSPSRLHFAAISGSEIMSVEVEIASADSAAIEPAEISGEEAAACKPEACALLLDTVGGEVWTWKKQITGRCAACGECGPIQVKVNGAPVPVAKEGERFSALVPLKEGENRVEVTCFYADGRVCDSQEVVFTQRLQNRPTARIQISLRPEGVLLSALASRPSEAADSPIVKYLWSARQGNPAPVPINYSIGPTQDRSILLPPPAVDGEYYFSLQIEDAQGRSDTTAAYFVVENGKPRLVNFAVENPAWIESAVIYGTVPHNFGLEPFRAVTEKLDYLKDLGITAIWLSPSTMTPDGGHGYSVSDYFTPRPDYGTSEDFKEMVRQAHARGIRVLMDFVPNHSSIRHPYMRHALAYGPASPYYDFYDRDDGIWGYTYYFSWESLPNLNYGNPELRRCMTEAFAHWVREYDVDGFRADASWGVRERSPDYWPEWRRELQRVKPDLLLIAESSARDPYYFDNGFDAAYDWTDALGHWSMEEVFDEEDGLVERLHAALTNEGRGYHPDALIMRFLNNNDTGRRFITRHGLPMTRAAAAMLLTLPGVPCVYTGQEVGAEFEPYRTSGPISWEDTHGLRDYYKKLIALHKEIPALHSRQWEILKVESEQQVYVYLRYAKPEDVPVLVVLNFSEEEAAAQISLPEKYAAAFSGRLKDLLSGEEVEVSITGEKSIGVSIPAATALLLVSSEN